MRRVCVPAVTWWLTVLVFVNGLLNDGCRRDGAQPKDRRSANRTPRKADKKTIEDSKKARKVPTGSTSSLKPSAGRSAFNLPNAPGVKALAVAQVTSLPRINIPLKRVMAHARKHCRMLWYGMYMRGRKLGYGKLGCAVERRGGKEVFVEKAHLLARLTSMGGVQEMELKGEVVFATSGRGEMLHFEMVQTSKGQKESVTIRRKSDGWHMVRTYRGGGFKKAPERKKVTEIKSNLTNGEWAYMTALAEGLLKPGMRYQYFDFDEEEMADTVKGLQVLASADRSLRGVVVRIYRVETVSTKDKTRAVAIHDGNGDPLEGTFMGFMQVKREEKTAAKRMGGPPVDVGLGIVIPAKLKTGDPRKVRRMRVVLTGQVPGVLGKHHRHQVVEQAKDKLDFTVTRESLAGLKPVNLPVQKPTLVKHLKAARNIEANHPDIRALARKAAGGAKTALEAAKKINRFVYKYLRKDLSTDLDSALAIAKARVGDCTEHAKLMVALCRAVGLPAREVSGVVYLPGLGGFGYHAWVEVWVGRWISADPSWDELPANATHIWLAGPDDSRGMQVIGAVKAKVLSVETD